MKQITVKNPYRNRKFGFGWNASPSEYPDGRGYYYEPPAKPDYTGTIRQVYEAIENDRTFASIRSGNTFHSTAWFYGDKRITGPVDWLSDLVMDNELGRTPASIMLEIED